ncbi:MAG TPA: hypothetical protein VFT13_09935 [Candidatus Krumholzibacteria bacterium]|nr:hypothetical protein [Candidatus Krumholzibacteria bacterium]
MKVLLFRPLLVAAGILVACSDDPAQPPGPAPPAAAWDVYLERFTGGPVSVSGTAADDLLVAAQDLLLHHDGTRWEPLPLPRSLAQVRGAWKTASGDLFLYDYRRVYRSNDQFQDFISLPRDRVVCALPTGEIFVAGFDNHVHRYDGDTWSSDALPGEIRIDDLYARSASEAYAVGPYGTIATFDGVSWAMVSLDSSRHFNEVWSRRPHVPLVVDSHGDVHEYEDGVLTRIQLASSFVGREIWGSGNDAYIAGRDDNWNGWVQHSDGSGWVGTRLGTGSEVQSGWTAPTGEIFTVTYDGVWRTHGGNSERLLGVADPYRDWIYALWSCEDGVFAVGEGAYRFDGERWIDLGKQDLTDAPAVAVHGTNGQNVYAVGSRMILHYDGTSWDWVSDGLESPLFGIWVSERDGFAVGAYGSIVRSAGNSWEKMASPTSRTLLAVSGWEGGAVAVGENGTIIRFDGDAWRDDESPVSWEILDVAAFGPARMVAVGDDPRSILVRDHRGWSVQEIETYLPHDYLFNYTTSVWGTSPSNLFVTQRVGDVHHFDGRTWTLLPRVVAGGARDIAGTLDGDVFVASESAVVRYRPR